MKGYNFLLILTYKTRPSSGLQTQEIVNLARKWKNPGLMYIDKKFAIFLKNLEAELKNDLPGENAQSKMAPTHRSPVTSSQEKAPPRPGAVLILLYPYEEGIKTALIQRTEYVGYHSNQVSFPGGKQEISDTNLYGTALRETEEEIGVNPQRVTYIGRLSDIYIPVSNFLVSPFLGALKERPQFKALEKEVKSILETDIRLIRDKSIIGNKEIKLANGMYLKTPYYNIQGHTVWGATAMILSELGAVLEKIG